MLTAKGDEIDRIVGLEMGADDYLPKPFNPRELVARIQAVLRRRVSVVPGAPTSEDKTITFGDVEVDLATRTLKRRGEELPLTTGEFAVLKVLLEHPRQPLSRDRLMTLARGREPVSYTHLDVYKRQAMGSIIPVFNHELLLSRGYGIRNVVGLDGVRQCLDNFIPLTIYGLRIPVFSFLIITACLLYTSRWV